MAGPKGIDRRKERAEQVKAKHKAPRKPRQRRSTAKLVKWAGEVCADDDTRVMVEKWARAGLTVDDLNAIYARALADLMNARLEGLPPDLYFRHMGKLLTAGTKIVETAAMIRESDVPGQVQVGVDFRHLPKRKDGKRLGTGDELVVS